VSLICHLLLLMEKHIALNQCFHRLWVMSPTCRVLGYRGLWFGLLMPSAQPQKLCIRAHNQLAALVRVAKANIGKLTVSHGKVQLAWKALIVAVRPLLLGRVAFRYVR
jgi:hypothetical protein